MAEAGELKTLNDWMEQLKAATRRYQVLALVDEFRRLEWTDVERSQIAKLYIRLLDILPEEKEPVVAKTGSKPESGANTAAEDGAAAPQGGAAAAPVEDEEVWYEKM